MTRRTRNPTMYAKYCEPYDPEPARYVPDPNPRAYHMIPASYPKIMGRGPGRQAHSNVSYPRGLVSIQGPDGITGPVVREITPGYLDRIFKGKTTVEARQRYAAKVIQNPRSPTKNVRVVVEYIRDNPLMFTPGETSPYYSDDINRIIRSRNGDADPTFVGRIRALFPGAWSE